MWYIARVGSEFVTAANTLCQVIEDLKELYDDGSDELVLITAQNDDEDENNREELVGMVDNLLGRARVSMVNERDQVSTMWLRSAPDVYLTRKIQKFQLQ